MRTYGQVINPDGSKTWTTVETDANGFDDLVWITTLAQTLKMVRGESPFWSNWGIPAFQSVAQQVPPDFYVTLTQQQFAPRFAALSVAKVAGRDPYYNINVVTNQGETLNAQVPIPT